MDGLYHFVEDMATPARAGAANRGVAAPRRLAIVDPSRLRRDCLKLALTQQARRWRVTDVAAVADFVRLTAQGECFAVILLGGTTCRRIRMSDVDLLLAAAPATPLLVAAECDDRTHALAILRAGASGFLPTNLSLKVLLAALERLRAGGTYVPLVLSEPAVAGSRLAAVAAPWCELTRRQCEVLALISQGLPNKSIAVALTMTESTVKAHVKGIIKRLNVANRTQAALLAARGGIARSFFPRAVVTA